MSRIIAIGGGSMIEGATASIDQEIVNLSGKKKPNALFIPTASSDNPEYCENFNKIYGEKLGCDTDSLLLLQRNPDLKEIKNKIHKADIIYVGGGNTLMMMRRWRFLGVDKMLVKAYKENKILAGTSAGAICWFEYGHSDSMFYYHPEKWEWIRVKCLGILPFTACPHYLKENRYQHFQRMMKKTGGIGIALDDCTAIEIIDDKYRILQSKPGAQAFLVYKKNGIVISEPFPLSKKFQHLALLKASTQYETRRKEH